MRQLVIELLGEIFTSPLKQLLCCKYPKLLFHLLYALSPTIPVMRLSLFLTFPPFFMIV